jgi:hypothetical protein
MDWKAEESQLTAKKEQKNFLSSTASRLTLEFTHPVDARGSFPGGKAACT